MKTSWSLSCGAPSGGGVNVTVERRAAVFVMFKIIQNALGVLRLATISAPPPGGLVYTGDVTVP